MVVIYIFVDQEGLEIQSMIFCKFFENYKVLKFYVEIGSEWIINIKDSLIKVDVIVVIFIECFMYFKWGEFELNIVILYMQKNSNKFLIFIIIGEFDFFYYLQDIQFVYFDLCEINVVDSVIEKIDRVIDLYLG